MDDQKIDKLINSMGLLEYKIDQLNETVDKTNKNREEIIVLNTKLEQIDSSVRELKRTNEKQTHELGKVQISIAKIMTWGTMGGGMITIVIELLKKIERKMAIDPNNLNDKIVLNRIANLEERMRDLTIAHTKYVSLLEVQQLLTSVSTELSALTTIVKSLEDRVAIVENLPEDF